MSKRKLLKKKMERKNKKLLKEKQKERLLKEKTKVNKQKSLMKGQLNMGKKEIFHNRMDLKKKEKDVEVENKANIPIEAIEMIEKS